MLANNVRAPKDLEGNYARGLRKYHIYKKIRVKSTIVDGAIMENNRFVLYRYIYTCVCVERSVNVAANGHKFRETREIVKRDSDFQVSIN